MGVISLDRREAVSRVALEWMAAGRPVVASTKVGPVCKEIVQDRITGYLTDPNDAPVLGFRLSKDSA